MGRLIFHNARIYTADRERPRAEAVAIEGGRFVAVGTDVAVLPFARVHTERIDVGGATIVPGLHDAHGHVLGLGERLEQLDLGGATSLEEMLDRVRARATSVPAGEWILGRGWDQNLWPSRAWPTAGALDAVAPDHLVALTRVDGHALVANSRALAIAGLSAATADPPGGRIIRDASGRPSGVLVDAAQDLVWRHVPAPDRTAIARRLDAADRHLSALGITMVHDAGGASGFLEAWGTLRAAGRARTRVYAMVRGDAVSEWMARGPLVDPSHHFSVRAVKLMADGALGSRGAALLDDYEDEPGNRGLLLLDRAELYERTRTAAAAGFQVATHAIGDRANRLVLDVFERVLGEHPPSARLRFRVEHAQLLAAADIPRFGRLGVIASVQAIHCPSDMPWARARVGPDRIRGAYAWRSLLDAGARLANGSDFPVEPANPLVGFHAAVTRQDAGGHPSGGWTPGQRLSRLEALRSCTLDAAYAAHAERDLGSIVAGKLADLVILSDDIMSIAPAAVLATRVLRTVIAGETVYEGSA